MAENKKPMTKAKKQFIAGIIWLIAGCLFVAWGGIMVTLGKQIDEICGVIILCCGSAIIGSGIYMVIKNYRLYKAEEKAR